jgi:hypothetical protein
MATFFRTKVVQGVGTTPTDIIATNANNRFTILGCNLANIIEDNTTIDISVVDSDSVEAYYVKGIVIPANSSLKVVTNGEKLILAENCSLRIVCDVPSSVDAIISYAEII